MKRRLVAPAVGLAPLQAPVDARSDACGVESLLAPVVAAGAFLRDAAFFTQRDRTVWTCPEALSAADAVVLADIYAARETDTLGISSADIASRIEKLGTEVHYFPTFEEIEAFLLKNCSTGDLLITMGAGDIVKVGEKLLNK